MHLSRICVRGFRCLKDVCVDLGDGLNALVGRNNTGKTAMMTAIRLALGPSSTRTDSVWLTEDDFTRSDKGPRETKIEIDLQFAGLNEKQRARFFEIVEFNLANPEESTASVHFEADWPLGKKRPTIRRWGGAPHPDHPQVPQEILERIPVTFLPALRDAEAALTPGYRSRLVPLLQDRARREKTDPKDAVEDIFEKANRELTNQTFIRRVRHQLRSSVLTMSGSDYRPMSIGAADPEFDRILRSLCIIMDQTSLSSIGSNGLGYNNLLYVATVLLHLSGIEEDECPILLVEEPEAHLHPQLTVLLGRFLGKKDSGFPQAVVTTHSPMLASSIEPKRIHVLYQEPDQCGIVCRSIEKTGLDPKEERALQRMMDVTRSTLYFCKGLILVEGISEALLVPVLATRLDYDLAQAHVAVLPICGVGFPTFEKLFSEHGVGIPVAIITDGDPPVVRGNGGWQEDSPKKQGDNFVLSDRTQGLLAMFNDHKTVTVKHSQVTLEYDLAEAGDVNADVMVRVWEDYFKGKPGTLNAKLLEKAGRNRSDRALTIWRGICRSDHTGSKADFAHRLAEDLQAKNKTNAGFEVPGYIRDAIEHVMSAIKMDKGTPDEKTD